MKLLLFDGTAMQSTKDAVFHGGGEYAKFIFEYLIENNIDFDIIIDSKRNIDDRISNLINSEFKGQVIESSSKQEIYNAARIENYKSFFTAHPYEYFDYSGSSRFIGVIHGLRAIELPWDKFKYHFYSNPLKRTAAYILGKLPIFIKYWRNKHITNIERILKIPEAKFITVSNHSKYSILNIFPFLKAEQLIVNYSPFKLLKGKKVNNTIPYFLMVSGNRYEKNVWRAAKTFDKLITDGRLSNYKIIILGTGHEGLWSKLKNQESFEFRGYVSYQELGDLYANAFAFVYPSLNEGFGYPPLYAMALGVPVIASSSTSIPEVCADAASIFSPTSYDDLASRILRLIDSEEYRDILITKGKKRVTELSNMQIKSVSDLITEILS